MLDITLTLTLTLMNWLCEQTTKTGGVPLILG
jgi:hypothetical protein